MLIGLIYQVSGHIGVNLVVNPGFEVGLKGVPTGYKIAGGANWVYDGYQSEIASMGVALDSDKKAGSISQVVLLRQNGGKWITFRFRGRAEDGFRVTGDTLYMQVDYLARSGREHLDTATRLIYRQVLKDRQAFSSNGDYGVHGASAWRTYQVEKLLPFPQVDAVKISVGFTGGAGSDKGYSHFCVDDFSLYQHGSSESGQIDPADGHGPDKTTSQPRANSLMPLGGRWFYQPLPGEKLFGKRVDITAINADRLYYKEAQYDAPFAGMMTAVLRKGFLDAQGEIVTKDRLIPNNVEVIFDGSSYFQVITHSIPNHPVGRFPDTQGYHGYDLNYIQEQVRKYWIPVAPRLNPHRYAIDKRNTNGALNMGPIGIAVNGVVFLILSMRTAKMQLILWMSAAGTRLRTIFITTISIQSV